MKQSEESTKRRRSGDSTAPRHYRPIAEAAPTMTWSSAYVVLPDRLTPRMRQEWSEVDGFATVEKQDQIFAILRKHAVRRSP